MGNQLDTVKIGNYIAGKRHDLGLTQQGLADRLNVTNKAVSKWETGQGAPDIGTLPRLAEILHVTVDEILMGEDAVEGEESENGGEKALYKVKTVLSRNNRLLCAKACWQSLRLWLRLIYLLAGVAMFCAALAAACVSRLTTHSVPPAVIVILSLLGAFFVILSVKGYYFTKFVRNASSEDENCTFDFMDGFFSVSREGIKKSWRYSHISSILETTDLFVMVCGKDIEFFRKQSLPDQQQAALRFFLVSRCRKSVYRSVSPRSAGRALGFGFAASAFLILLFQLAYLFMHSKYGVVYKTEITLYVINFMALFLTFMSSIFLAYKRPIVCVFTGILCAALSIANITSSVFTFRKTQDIISHSPGGKNELILKRDRATYKTERYRHPFLFFAVPYDEFPYTVYGKIKTQWLADDICAVTYVSEKNGPAHQIVETYGSRGRTDHYYVEAAIDGSWEPSGQNTAGWKLVRDTKGVVLSNGSTEYDYSAKDCVQYGLTALVLCKGGLPQWTVTLNEDCKIDAKTMLVSYGGTLTLCKVSMDKTAPLTLRSTSKSSVTQKSELAQSAEKDDYRISGDSLYFTWDYGHRWTTVPLSKSELNSALKTGSKQSLSSGCYHIADDFSYIIYGRKPLTVLFAYNEGKVFEKHSIANIEGEGIASRYIVYTSGQTAYAAVGLEGTADIKGSLLYMTSNGGITWQNLKSPSDQTLTGMNFLSQNVGYLSYTDTPGDSGTLYETTDGGKDFSQVKLETGSLSEIGAAVSGLAFSQVYDTPQVPILENSKPVLYVTQGSDGDLGTYRAKYESSDGGKTWKYVSQEQVKADSNS